MYTICSILFIVFIILVIMAAFITSAHVLQPPSRITSGGGAPCCAEGPRVFIYGYCFYYYYTRSDMSGFMQTASSSDIYFCHYGFFLMLGNVGFTRQALRQRLQGDQVRVATRRTRGTGKRVEENAAHIGDGTA